VSLGGVDIHVNYEAFLWSCCNGMLEVAQWLWGLGGVDIHSSGDEAFRLSCSNGKLEVAQWLWGLGGVDIHASGDDAFWTACSLGELEVARWLVSVGSEPDVFTLRNWSPIRTMWVRQDCV
jgi:hypothetical protein